MKKLLVVAALSLSGLAAFGQGQLTFGNNFAGSFIMPIYGMDPANTTSALSGVPSTGRTTGVFPSNGSVAYPGLLLQGTGYTLQLWAGASSASLQPLYTTSFRTATADKLPAGLVSGQISVVIPGVDAGQQAFYQVRVWDNKGGSLTTWGAASDPATPGATFGSSAVVLSGPLGGQDATGGIHLPMNSVDWVSFNIHQVPEPTSFALAGLGAAAMLIFRRRK